jgi:hypothetical protein
MTIPLRSLGPRWLRFERRQDGIYHIVCRRERAQGIAFDCPKCRGGAGAHRVVCWSRRAGVPEDAHPGPGRWQLVGETFDTLTLKGESTLGLGADHPRLPVSRLRRGRPSPRRLTSLPSSTKGPR